MLLTHKVPHRCRHQPTTWQVTLNWSTSSTNWKKQVWPLRWQSLGQRRLRSVPYCPTVSDTVSHSIWPGDVIKPTTTKQHFSILLCHAQLHLVFSVRVTPVTKSSPSWMLSRRWYLSPVQKHSETHLDDTVRGFNPPSGTNTYLTPLKY